MWRLPTGFGKRLHISEILLPKKLLNLECTKIVGSLRFKTTQVEICTQEDSRERGISNNGRGFVMKNEHKDVGFRVITILFTIISVIISVKHAQNVRDSGVDDSVWSIIGYVLLVSVVLFSVSAVSWFLIRGVIKDNYIDYYMEQNKDKLDTISMSEDKSTSVFDEINNRTLDNIWDGEDSESIQHWDYETKKRRADEKRNEIYRKSLDYANEKLKHDTSYNLIFCLICTGVAVIINLICRLVIVNGILSGLLMLIPIGICIVVIIMVVIAIIDSILGLFVK